MAFNMLGSQKFAPGLTIVTDDNEYHSGEELFWPPKRSTTEPKGP